MYKPGFKPSIEKELGIEPPDLEGIWNENLRIQKEQEEEYIKQQNEFKIVYHYISEIYPKQNHKNN